MTTLDLDAELKAHIIDCINEHELTDFSELHHKCFNTDYYIIGYYQANQWLKSHDIDAFEAIDYVRQYEMDNFGEFNTKINSESIVNMYVYIKGEEILNSLDVDLNKGCCTKDELLAALQD